MFRSSSRWLAAIALLFHALLATAQTSSKALPLGADRYGDGRRFSIAVIPDTQYR
jgi:hypothetical protein